MNQSLTSKRIAVATLNVVEEVLPEKFHLAQFLALSPDDRLVAVGGHTNRNVLVVLDTAAFSVVFQSSYDSFVECPIPSFTADGSVLCVVLRCYEGSKNLIHLYDATDFREQCKTKTNTTSVQMSTIFGDGSKVAVCSSDGLCKIFGCDEIRAAANGSDTSEVMLGHAAGVNFVGPTGLDGISISSSRDLNNAAQGQVLVWDVLTGRVVVKGILGTRHYAILDSGASVGAAGSDSARGLFLKQTGLGIRFPGDPQRIIVSTVPQMAPHTELPVTVDGDILFALVAAGGTRVVVAIGAPAHEIWVWDVAFSQKVASFPSVGLGSDAGMEVSLMRMVHPDIIGVVYSDAADKVQLLQLTGERVCQVSASPSLSQLADMLGLPGSLVVVGHSYTPTGSRGSLVALGCHFPDCTETKPVVSIVRHVHGKRATLCRASPDGQYVASTGHDTTILLWSPVDWTVLCSFVDDKPVTALGVIVLPGFLHILAGNDGGRVLALRYVRSEADILTADAHAGNLARLTDVEKMFQDAKPKPTLAAQLQLLPQDGGGALLYIDDVLVEPMDEKVMYTQGWTVPGGVISANPRFSVAEWQVMNMRVCMCA